MKEEKESKPTDLQIEEWSEGNEHLKKLLLSCRENDIHSMFCCAGHNENTAAYIMFKIDKKTIGKIYNIFNNLRDTKNISFAFSRNPLFSCTKFSVYMYDDNEKNSIMDNISKAICEQEKLENLPINFQLLLELVELLISNKFNFDLSYYKGEGKELYFRNFLLNDIEYPFKRKLEKLGFISKENGIITKYFLKNINDDNEEKVLKKTLNGMKSICTEISEKSVKNDGFENQERILFEKVISNNGKLKNITTSIGPKENEEDIKRTIERD